MRARARAACRFSETAQARWLLNAHPVAKTDARIVFLSEFWFYMGYPGGQRQTKSANYSDC